METAPDTEMGIIDENKTTHEFLESESWDAWLRYLETFSAQDKRKSWTGMTREEQDEVRNQWVVDNYNVISATAKKALVDAMGAKALPVSLLALLDRHRDAAVDDHRETWSTSSPWHHSASQWSSTWTSYGDAQEDLWHEGARWWKGEENVEEQKTIAMASNGSTSTPAIRGLEQQLCVSIGREDYLGAARIKAEISKMKQGSRAEADLAAKIQTCIAEQDYLQAAKFQAELKALQAQNVEDSRTPAAVVTRGMDAKKQALQNELNACIAKEDYKRAAEVKEQLQNLTHLQEEDTITSDSVVRQRLDAKKQSLDNSLAACVAREDYARAAELKKEIQNLACPIKEDKQAATKDARRRLDAKKQALEKSLAACIAEEDYTRAAEIKEDIQNLCERSQGNSACAEKEKQKCDLQAQIQLYADAGDFANAAQLQRKMNQIEPEEVRGTSRTAMAPSTAVDVEDLFQHGLPLPSLITLRQVHVLSISLVSINSAKGKGKDKGKLKTKGKSNSPSKGKVKDTGECRAIYVGAKGRVVCVLAFSAAVASFSQLAPGCLVEIDGLRLKQGVAGTLEATSKLVVIVDSQATPAKFPYYVDEVTDQFASMEHAQQANVQTYIDLVLQCTSVEQNEKSDGELYASLHGRDMNGVIVGPLRMWRFSATDVHNNNIYIIRGLKVILDRYWCNQSWEWKPCTDGSKRLECNFRTAIEDVTAIDSIAKMFE